MGLVNRTDFSLSPESRIVLLLQLLSPAGGGLRFGRAVTEVQTPSPLTRRVPRRMLLSSPSGRGGL